MRAFSFGVLAICLSLTGTLILYFPAQAQEEASLPASVEEAVSTDDFSASNTEGATPTASEEAAVVYANLDKIAQNYFQQVEDYRNIEKRYLIARETYYQNNTLAAQDEAIRRAKEVMQARLTVLDTYFAYLQHALDQTLGIELDDKQLMSTHLGNIRADIEIYEELIANAQDRYMINVEFQRLNEKKRDFQSTAYSTLALMKIGQLQIAIDQGHTSRDKVEEWLQQADISEAQKAKKERGLEEVDLLINRASNNLVEVQTDWRRRAGETYYGEGTYRSFQDKAEYSYLQLRQALTFLQEVVNQV